MTAIHHHYPHHYPRPASVFGWPVMISSALSLAGMAIAWAAPGGLAMALIVIATLLLVGGACWLINRRQQPGDMGNGIVMFMVLVGGGVFLIALLVMRLLVWLL